MTENPYWIVSDLSYGEACKLADASCVDNFQHDERTGETKFWPGTPEVLAFLRTATHHNITDTSGNWRSTRFLQNPSGDAFKSDTAA